MSDSDTPTHNTTRTLKSRAGAKEKQIEVKNAKNKKEPR